MPSRIVLLLAAVSLALPAFAQQSQVVPVQGQQRQQQFDYQRAMRNLQAIRSGQKTMNQLSPHEQTEAQALARLLARPHAPNEAPDCRDAWDRTASAADEVASYADRLKRCVEAGDFTEDCSTEFRRVRNAHGDYESAVSQVNSECR
jgi:hypothetical protein